MGVREYDYIRGNTALAPDKKIKETEKQRKKQRIQSKKRERAMKKNILIAGFTGVFGRLISYDAFVLVFIRFSIAALSAYVILKAFRKIKAISFRSRLQGGRRDNAECRERDKNTGDRELLR